MISRSSTPYIHQQLPCNPRFSWSRNNVKPGTFTSLPLFPMAIPSWETHEMVQEDIRAALDGRVIATLAGNELSNDIDLDECLDRDSVGYMPVSETSLQMMDKTKETYELGTGRATRCYQCWWQPTCPAWCLYTQVSWQAWWSSSWC